ncbi:MAG: hypothetical protein CSB44_12275 [Gammaproteobacteria bacterium]|nr:MAG: hypothetical protein CSB44_12275 [Gammaproteobacteria bacterium]
MRDVGEAEAEAETPPEAASAISVSAPEKGAGPLRVLHAIDSRFPGPGGAESQAGKLAAALRDKGVKVEFVSPRILDEEGIEDEVDGIRLRRINYPHIRFLGSIMLMFGFARYLWRRRRDFDVVHIHITHLFAAAAGYARPFTGMPIITKISGFYEFEGGVLDRRLRFRPVNLLVRTGLHRVDHVQTISEQTHRKLLEAGFREDQILFVPNGIRLDPDPPPPPSARPLRIGYCGRLRHVKGVHVLLDALRRVEEMRPGAAEVVIAGNGDTWDELHAQSEKLGLADKVHWLGQIDDTAPFFRSIDIYVQPSFAEGLPNSVLEAMAAERVVVASDIGGNNDLITNDRTGLLFEAGDDDALARKLVELIDDPAARVRLAADGRAFVARHYGIDAVTSDLEKAYRGNLSAPSAAGV